MQMYRGTLLPCTHLNNSEAFNFKVLKMKNLKYNFLLILIIFCSQLVEGQNLNTPNKTGPLGTQVNTITGNLFVPRLDFLIAARGLDIEMEFYYNSYDFNRNYNYGNGWSFIYDIFYSTDTSHNKIIKWGDGREDKYILSGADYLAPRGFFDKLSQYQPNKFLLTKKNGVKFYFDNNIHKKITRLEEPMVII